MWVGSTEPETDGIARRAHQLWEGAREDETVKSRQPNEMTTESNPIESLVALGFTELEATVYTYLVGNSPATGYRVAHDIGKPIANTYKAIKSLHQKGAAMVDTSGENRQVRAVAPEELLDQLGRAFHDRYEAATRAFRDLGAPERDIGVYTLANVNQVISRAREMLRDAEKIALCDLFPRALEEVRDQLEEAAARGVTVVAKTYQPTQLQNVELVVSPRGGEVREEWPGTWMNLVIDERELLLALLDKNAKGVRQAVWSGSPFLSVVYHIAFSWEITGSRVERALQSNGDLQEIRELIADFQRIEAPEAPGYQEIVGSDFSPEGPPVADLLDDE